MGPGGSNESPRSKFKSKNKKLMYTPVNPTFTIDHYLYSIYGHVHDVFDLSTFHDSFVANNVHF